MAEASQALAPAVAIRAQVVAGGNDGGNRRDQTVVGDLLYADVGLSFWGGVDPSTGEVIDRSHALSGQNLAGKILAIPGSRGSCTGSQVLLELLLNNLAPAAILLQKPDEIIAIGTVIAEELFGCSLPVLSLGAEGFGATGGKARAIVEGDVVYLLDADCEHLNVNAISSLLAKVIPVTTEPFLSESDKETPQTTEPLLSESDKAMLSGASGDATQVAMRVVLRAAMAQGAKGLLDVTQVHIDGCTYGHPGSDHPAGLRFAQKLLELGGRVRVPTTLNSGSVDRRRWRELGVHPDFGVPASALGDAYVAMGAKPSFTCAPYLLDSAPLMGEQIGWGESNAVVFANSVLGARTQKYADFLDICIAITGRAPSAGCHLDDERRARVVLTLPEDLGSLDDAFYPTLGYLCGLKAETRVPAIVGLEKTSPSIDDLKAFSAAFGTAASIPMFHIVGVTPEAPDLSSALGRIEPEKMLSLTLGDLESAWRTLDRSQETEVDLVSLGNPHLSLQEYARLASLCHGRQKHPDVRFVVTSGREILEQARAAGHLESLESFGAEIINDTCWCMLGEPVVPRNARTLMTNSAKYAHYAPGLVNRQVRFATMEGCVSAALTRAAPRNKPPWLLPRFYSSRASSTLHGASLRARPWPSQRGRVLLTLGELAVRAAHSYCFVI